MLTRSTFKTEERAKAWVVATLKTVYLGVGKLLNTAKGPRGSNVTADIESVSVPSADTIEITTSGVNELRKSTRSRSARNRKVVPESDESEGQNDDQNEQEDDNEEDEDLDATLVAEEGVEE
ncbi:hypothetical protein OCU04_008850 [Sclerotinia nivalis]|uniref:Uncharacterized protein n=1 Tax=Sclerotinia nivalis TaxID=352851 RepID=A0A9X0AHH8_9HELO|nr:hypothetical protein OCU04_008850 [Sclerotinia nivalis]